MILLILVLHLRCREFSTCGLLMNLQEVTGTKSGFYTLWCWIV